MNLNPAATGAKPRSRRSEGGRGRYRAFSWWNAPAFPAGELTRFRGANRGWSALLQEPTP